MSAPRFSAPESRSVGAPVSSWQAADAILRLIDSAMAGDITADPHPGVTLERFERNGTMPALSSGEQVLAAIAKSIWTGKGADVSDIGALDRDNRRKVLGILVYYFLGRDMPLKWDASEWGWWRSEEERKR